MADPEPIRCRSGADPGSTRCRSKVDPRSILNRSAAGPLLILGRPSRSIADAWPVRDPSGIDLGRIRGRSGVEPRPIRGRPRGDVVSDSPTSKRSIGSLATPRPILWHRRCLGMRAKPSPLQSMSDREGERAGRRERSCASRRGVLLRRPRGYRSSPRARSQPPRQGNERVRVARRSAAPILWPKSRCQHGIERFRID